MKNIPFLDLKQLYADHREEFDAAMSRVIERAAFIGGEELQAFEREFAAWVSPGFHATGCANGTDAIDLAARSFHLPPGSQAIVPAMTFMATAAALIHAGLKPKLVDVEAETWLLDCDAVEKAMTPDVRLIVPVHLYGQMARMDRLREIADRHRCGLLEDAAQAHGAKWKDKPIGHWGDVATFSFFPGKNLGAFGDAGGVVSRDAQRVQYCKALANQGGLKKYEHDYVGMNSRLDNLQAAVLGVKLKYIDRWNDRRRQVASLYRQGLSRIPGLDLPKEREGAKHVYHLFVVLVEDREKFRAFLTERGVETGVHYPKALHQHAALREMYAGQSFPNAERLARHGVSLPMGPTLTDEQVGRVIEAVSAYFGK